MRMENKQFHEEQLPLSNKAGVCGGDIAEDISNTRHNHADYHGRGGTMATECGVRNLL